MLQTKVVLLTGVSSDIGRATARYLAQRGYRIFGTSREIDDLSIHGVELVELNVNSNASVKACVDEVLSKAGHIDVLVNLASVVLEGAVEEVSMDEVKSLFETNFFGMLRITQAVLPVMRRQHSGRIINISGLSGAVGLPFYGMLCASRSAVEAVSESLWNEMQAFNVQVSVLQIMTAIRSQGFEHSYKLAVHRMDEYSDAREHTLHHMRPVVESGAHPKVVAEAIYNIIQSQSPRIRYQIGSSGTLLLFLKRVITDTSFIRTLGKGLIEY